MLTQINFHPAHANRRGLRGGKLERLGKVVVLAGPNGSGKSRYLRLVQEICRRFDNLSQNASNLSLLQNQLAALQSQLKSSANDVGPNTLQSAIARAEESLQKAIQAEELVRQTSFSPAFTDDPPTLIPLSYPTDSEQISDARSMSPVQLKDAAHATITVGFDSAFVGMHAYCTEIAQAMCHSEVTVQVPGLSTR